MSAASPSRRVPGSRLRALVVGLFDDAAASRILLPAIADLQHEIAEAGAGSRLRRMMVRWRVYLAFWRTFAACLLFRRSDEDRQAFGRIVVADLCTLAVMTALMWIGPAILLLRARVDLRIVLLLLPQSLAVSIPCSVIGAGLLGPPPKGRIGPPPMPLVRGTLAYAALAAVTSFAVMVWVLPSANQEYRQRIFQISWPASVSVPRSAILVKGFPEMTIGELREARRRAVLQARWVNAEGASYYLHLKGAIPAAALGLGLMAIAVSPRKRSRWFSPFVGLASAIVALIGYYVALAGMRELVWSLAVPAWVGAWAPPMTFSALALLVLWLRVAHSRA